MYCPALEYEITQNKKRAERARELSRNGFCYIEVQDKSNNFLITDILRMSLGEYKELKLSISMSKKYKIVNGFWSDVNKKTIEQYQDDIEMDNPIIINRYIINP